MDRATTMIARRQPWAFDGGGMRGRQRGTIRFLLGIPFVCLYVILLQMRITEAKIGNYIS